LIATTDHFLLGNKNKNQGDLIERLNVTSWNPGRNSFEPQVI
jgi:hypothetical protein